ncbi:MAG: hypothetical protein NTV34_12745 [Proteobacteria bacterium]|nr:hypothetical protein [Pseudomonadota bacterium]
MKRILGGAVAVTIAAASSPVLGNEVTQRVGGYHSTDGESRATGSLGGTLERGAFGTSSVSSASYNIDAGVEKIRITNLADDRYMQDYFPEGSRLQRSVALGTSHTINKLTDFRLGGNWNSDLVTKTKSISGGVGHWWRQDTIQTNLDFSRTILDRPDSYVLDYDRETVLLTPKVTSGGATFSFKHLATPTTIWGGSYTRVDSSDRPRLHAFGAQVKQFIPALTASIHGAFTRIVNTGPVTTQTTSGSLAGIQAEVAVLKSLWQGAAGRAAYRYAREDEERRAFGDHVVHGADSYTLGLSQDINKGILTDRPVTASVVGTRYITNGGVSASLGEAVLAVKF